MNTWIVLSGLVILGFIAVECLVIRSHRGHRQKIDFFYTLHRLLVQRKGFRIEDVISLAGFFFVVLLIVLLIFSRQVEIETPVQADAVQGPVVMESAEEAVVLEEEAAVPPEETWIVDGDTVQHYEEYVFDVRPAMLKDDIAWEAEYFMVSTGEKKLDPSSSGELMVQAQAVHHGAGYLAVSDPTTLQKKGTYEAVFRLRFSDPSEAAVVSRIELWDEHENKLLHSQELRGTDFSEALAYQDVSLRYEREQRGSIQARVWYEGVGDLAFDKVLITALENQGEDYKVGLFYSDVPDIDASEGMARWANWERDIPGRLAFGPYDDSLSEGHYRATFRLKVKDNASPLKVALIDVYSDGSDFVPAHRHVRGQDFLDKGAYQTFSLDFYKGTEGALEFRVYYFGVTDLYFDGVDLHRLTRIDHTM